MKELLRQIAELKKSSLRDEIEERLQTFKSFAHKPSDAWFSELCFCILAANAQGKKAFEIQQDIGTQGLLRYPQTKIRSFIRKHNHRFHNTKAKFIVQARKHDDIKETIRNSSPEKAREWLVENVDGIGYKEASHFLRNVGYFDFAILDRHILNVMAEHGLMKQVPKTLTKKKYLALEKKFLALAEKSRMEPGELDFYIWCMKTGEVVK